MTERKDAKPKAERDKRMLKYIDDKLSCAEIGRLEGLQADYACKERRIIARANGLSIPKDTASHEMPDGIDDESKIFRKRLAGKLDDLLVLKRWSAMDVAKRVSVPRKLQKKALGTDKPDRKPLPSYDWSLSQLQKLAKAHGMSFKDFMIQQLETRDGFN